VCSVGFCWRLYTGIDGFNVCVLLEFVERLYTNYMLELMVSMWVILKFVERLCAEIDYCICVFCWNLVTVYVLGLITACVCVFMLKSCDFART
jgi:hypothetical protein